MQDLGTEFRVGVFTILGVAVTIGSIFILSPDLFESSDVSEYTTILDDAAGIMPKTHVKTNGVTVGKVTSVELDNLSTKVTFQIRGDVKLPKGSSIEVKTVGFLGDKFIEIHRGKDSKEFIAEGGLVPPNTEVTSLDQVVGLVGSIAKDIKKVTERLANVLGTDEGEVKMANIVDNIEAFTKDARGILEDNRDDVRTMIANFADFSESVNDVLDEENKERINRILAAFDDSMIEVKGATKNINLISERLERGEGTLGKLINDDEAIEELQGAIKDIRKVLAPVNQLQVAVDYHGEVRRDETTQNYFNLVFRTRPDSYYLLGFTDMETKVEDTTITENADGETGKTRKEIVTKNALRFNLQFAKRWHDFALRFGLFESSGGLASDFYLFSDRLKLTVEAFDWKSKDNPVRRTAHVKAYASVLFYKHIYAMVGVDDPTRLDPDTKKVDKKVNYFAGAGVTFNDQDLKAIFGTAAIAL